MTHRTLLGTLFVLLITFLVVACAEDTPADPTDTVGTSDTELDPDDTNTPPTDTEWTDTDASDDPEEDAWSSDATVADTAQDAGEDVVSQDGTIHAPDVDEPTNSCESANDCTVTEYEWMVTASTQCFCPECPTTVVTITEHEARKDAWTEYCVEWASAMDCPDFDCESPPELACVEGVCGVANPTPNTCDTNVDCDADPPQCDAGLIPVNKGGCWGCGYPETCSCSDGSTLECESKIPQCEEDEELAIIDGCHSCVNAMTCAGEPNQEGCGSDEECTFTQYKDGLGGTAMCYCPKCPIFPTTLVDHEEREALWILYCSDWAFINGCPETPGCLDPGKAVCEKGECGKEALLPPSPCDVEVTCEDDPPKCFINMVLVNKDGCWGCGYAETCSCSDGSPQTCDMNSPFWPPTCAETEELAVINECYLCVDPITCMPTIGVPPVPEPKECKDDAECIYSEFIPMVKSEADCYCPMCPFSPMSIIEHEARLAAWVEHCTEWGATNPCPDIACEDPGEAICDEGICVDPGEEPTPIACDTNVDCDGPQPDCAEPLIPVNKDGCWACAYPDTCTCSDGQPVICDTLEPECPEGTEPAKQGGCHECVNPMTCAPMP